MALIKCSECGKEFSDKASACPNCACPVTASKSSFCTNCGTPIMPDQGSFCTNCGSLIAFSQTNQSQFLFETDWNGAGRKGKLIVFTDKVTIKNDFNPLYLGQNGEYSLYYKDMIGIAYRKPGAFIKGVIQFNTANQQMEDIFYINFGKKEEALFQQYYQTMLEQFNRVKRSM